MKYYLHDTSSFEDEKVTQLYAKFGYEGLGLFYTTLEKLAKQEKPVKTDVLKIQLRVGRRLEKIWSFMEEIGILSSNNGETFNENLMKVSQKYKIKKESTKIRVANFREKQQDVTRYSNTCNAPKVNKSKVNKSKVNILQTEVCEEVPDLLKDKQKHIKIIGLYAKAKQVEFKNKEQQSSFIKRNLRGARSLAGYDINRIIETMKHLIDNADFKWTIESVGKYIDEDINKLTNKDEDEEISNFFDKYRK